MRRTLITLTAVILGVAFGRSAEAQSQVAYLDRISADEREALTLTRRKPSHDGCSARSKVPALHTDATSRITSLMAGQPAGKPWYALYSVQIDTAGAAHVRVLESSLDDTRAERLAAELASGPIFVADSGRSLPKSTPGGQYARLRLDTSPGVEPIRTGASVSCAPSLKNRDALGKRISEISRKLPALKVRLPQSVTVLARALLRPDGSIEEVELHESSGFQVADDLLIEMVRERAKFEPATIDEHGIRAWAQIPLVMRRY